MRRVSVLILVLVSVVLLTGATVYRDKSEWDLLWVDPSSSVVFSSRGNNATTLAELSPAGTYLVPRDAFSSSWYFESYSPGGAFFHAVKVGPDSTGQYFIAPADTFKGIAIVFSAGGNPFSFYTNPDLTGFVGVVPGSAETRYNAIVDRIYRLNYGFSAYVAPEYEDQTEDWTALIGTWDGSKWTSDDPGLGYQYVTLTPGSWATGYLPGYMKLTFSAASINIIVGTSLAGYVELTVSSEEEIDFSSYGEVSFLQFGGTESPFSVSKIEFK